jgi:FkbM family methyltransferase
VALDSPLYQKLKALERRWARVPARACGRALALLGPDPASRIKEAISIEGYLDYPGARIKMVVDSPIALGRLGACRKEPETVAWLEATFLPGDVLYDVGANVGAYSFVADAVARGRGFIYALEPGFSTFAALASNVLLNGAGDRIVALQLALGARTELTTMSYSSLRAGAASHRVGAPEVASAAPRQTIPAYRLDDLLRTFGSRPPTHLKIDVDGGELGVLQGAETALASGSIRSLLVEVDDVEGAGRAVLSFLAERGYEETERHSRVSGLCANVIFQPRATS